MPWCGVLCLFCRLLVLAHQQPNRCFRVGEGACRQPSGDLGALEPRAPGTRSSAVNEISLDHGPGEGRRAFVGNRSRAVHLQRIAQVDGWQDQKVGLEKTDRENSSTKESQPQLSAASAYVSVPLQRRPSPSQPPPHKPGTRKVRHSAVSAGKLYSGVSSLFFLPTSPSTRHLSTAHCASGRYHPPAKITSPTTSS